MKVNCSPDVCRKLPLNRSATATAIDLFASVTFAVAAITLIAAAGAAGTVLAQVMKYGSDFAVDPWLSAGKAVA